MKLEVEIKDNKFYFKWSVGLTEQASGECNLGAEELIQFSKMLQCCYGIRANATEKMIQKISGEVALAMASRSPHEGSGKGEDRK